MLAFGYHADILKTFPQVRGGVILAKNLIYGPTPQELLANFLAEQRAVLMSIGDTPLSELASLAAWRTAFRVFGVKPTKYRSAIEALLRRLTKKGDIPSINTLVDICNLVSIRHTLPIAAFDAHVLQGGITVCFADGSERFISHDQAEIEHPAKGEVVFADESGLVVARRWCWKQSLESTVQAHTREAIITIESQHVNGEVDVQAALDDLLELLDEYIGGFVKSDVLGPDNPLLSFQ